MNLTAYVDKLRRELAVAAEAAGPEARALAERLVTPLDSAIRITLLDALSAAADEITRDLAPGSVDLRLRASEPSFIVTKPPPDQSPDDLADRAFGAGSTVSSAAPPESRGAHPEESGISRISLRLPGPLKVRIEEAADKRGLSINAWLVRALAAAVESESRDRRSGPDSSGGRRVTGWVG